MFEKEAEDYAKKWILDEDDILLVLESFKDGAEFGYNKANEWHFVKDGKLPNEGESVLVLLENGECEVSGISTDKRWFCTDYYTGENDVIAWKEIVLPELPKESE